MKPYRKKDDNEESREKLRTIIAIIGVAIAAFSAAIALFGAINSSANHCNSKECNAKNVTTIKQTGAGSQSDNGNYNTQNNEFTR